MITSIAKPPKHRQSEAGDLRSKLAEPSTSAIRAPPARRKSIAADPIEKENEGALSAKARRRSMLPIGNTQPKAKEPAAAPTPAKPALSYSELKKREQVLAEENAKLAESVAEHRTQLSQLVQSVSTREQEHTEQMSAQQQTIDKLRQEVESAREQAEAAKAACREKEAQLEAQLKSRMAEFQEQCSQECKRLNVLLAEEKARVSLYEKALEKAAVDLETLKPMVVSEMDKRNGQELAQSVHARIDALAQRQQERKTALMAKLNTLGTPTAASSAPLDTVSITHTAPSRQPSLAWAEAAAARAMAVNSSGSSKPQVHAN